MGNTRVLAGTIVWLLVMIIWNIGVAAGLSAAPMPLKLAINHNTHQCGEYIPGDECMNCYPPEGWEDAGWASEANCPAGYEMIRIQPRCVGFKIARCCTQGHSGALGDCDDLVMNAREKQCAFAENIDDCVLPAGWQSKPVDISPREWQCPQNYRWIENFSCLTVQEIPAAHTTSAGARDQPIWIGVGAISLIILGTGGVIFARRRR